MGKAKRSYDDGIGDDRHSKRRRVEKERRSRQEERQRHDKTKRPSTSQSETQKMRHTRKDTGGKSLPSFATMKKTVGEKSLSQQAFTPVEKEILITEVLRNRSALLSTGRNFMTVAQKNEIWARITSKMLYKTKIIRKPSSVSDKFKRWRAEVKNEAMRRFRFSKGTGGGPAYDEAFHDDDVESYLEKQKQNCSSGSSIPSDSYLDELVLATLTKDQVEGFDGGTETGLHDLDRMQNESSSSEDSPNPDALERNNPFLAPSSGSDDDCVVLSVNEKTARQQVVVKEEFPEDDIPSPEFSPVRRTPPSSPLSRSPLPRSPPPRSPPPRSPSPRSPLRVPGSDEDLYNENSRHTVDSLSTMTIPGLELPPTRKRVVTHAYKGSSGLSQEMTQMCTTSSKKPIMTYTDESASSLNTHHILVINQHLHSNTVVNITRLGPKGLKFEAVIKD